MIVGNDENNSGIMYEIDFKNSKYPFFLVAFGGNNIFRKLPAIYTKTAYVGVYLLRHLQLREFTPSGEGTAR